MSLTNDRRRRFATYMKRFIQRARADVRAYWNYQRTVAIREYLEYRDSTLLKLTIRLPFKFRLRLYRDVEGFLDKKVGDIIAYPHLDEHVLMINEIPSNEISQDDLVGFQGGRHSVMAGRPRRILPRTWKLSHRSEQQLSLTLREDVRS